MSPNILRSVVKQVTLGGRSLVSRRNLSTRSRCNFCTRPRRNYSYTQESGDSDLFGSSCLIGYNVFLGYETIQILEYGRTMQRSMDERTGRVSKYPMRDFLIGMLRMNSRK